MRKLILGVLLFALAVAPAATLADDHVSVNVETWTRGEYHENLSDFNDDTRDNADILAYRARINLNVQATEEFGATLELQNYGIWGDRVFFPQSGDPVNGQIDQDPFNLTTTGETELYQGFITLNNIGGSNLSLKVGRQEHTLGNELHLGDQDYYGGQSYDGVRGMLELETWDLDFFYYKVADRDVGLGGFLGSTGGSDDSDLLGVTAAFDIADGHALEPYILYMSDNNEGGDPFFNFTPKYSAYTVGALYEGGQEDGMFDWSAEFALQSGDIGTGAAEVDLDSNVFEGNFGVKFGADNAHRVSLGVLRLGDGDDPVDSEAFMELFTDTHRRAGRMDMFTSGGFASTAIGADSFHNLTNIFLDWNWTSGNNTFGAAYHTFTLTEDFGGPEDDLGSELDLWWEHASGEHVTFAINLGTYMPGDLFLAPNDEDAMRATGMLRFRK